MKWLVPILGLFVFGLQSCSSNEEQNKEIPTVQTISPKTQKIVIYEEFVGQIYGKVDIPIRARVTGFLEGIHFKEGRIVKKDQLLYSIDPQPYEAEVAAQKSKEAEAQTEMVRAKNELIRYEELIKTKAVSQSDYDATKAQAEASEASYEAAKANVRMAEINLGYCKMMSPIDGVIGQTKAKVGEFVGKDPNPVILNTVSHVQDVRVIFFLTEKQYLNLARVYSILGDDGTPEERDTNDADIRLILADGQVHPYKGQVDFINREVDATTGSILVQASFPNPKRILRPGQYAKVKIRFGEKDNATLIPQRCLRELQGRYSIQVVTDSNTIQTVQVEVGTKVGDMAWIEKGLNASQQVVISAGGIPSGTPVNADQIEFESKTPIEE